MLDGVYGSSSFEAQRLPFLSAANPEPYTSKSHDLKDTTVGHAALDAKSKVVGAVHTDTPSTATGARGTTHTDTPTTATSTTATGARGTINTDTPTTATGARRASEGESSSPTSPSKKDKIKGKILVAEGKLMRNADKVEQGKVLQGLNPSA